MKSKILKKSAVALLAIGVCFACNTKKGDKNSEESTMEMTASTENMDIKIVENYFPKNDITPRVIQYFTIDNQKDFEQRFGVAKTMANEIEEIDFKKNRIGVILLPTTDVETTIEITKAERFGSGAIINFEIEEGAQQSFSTTPALIFKLPADNKLKTLEFKSDQGNKVLNVPAIQ